MREGWVDCSLSDITQISRERVDPLTLDPDSSLVHWSIPALDASGGPTVDEAKSIGSHKFKINSNSVLISLLNPRIPRFAMAAGGDNVVCSTEFAVITPTDQVQIQFLHVLASSSQVQQQIANLAKGTTKSRERAKAEDLSTIRIALPPLAEQRRIVDVIESVDNYITALETRAETARTARSALLHDLLSNPGPDWVQTTLGDVADYVNGFPFKPSDLGDFGLPVIRIKQLLDPLEPTDRSEIATPERCHLRDGDIVFSWSGTLAVRRWERGAALLNQHLFRVLEKPGVDRAWLIAVLDHAITELDEKSHGTTMKHITKQTLLPHKVFLPPLIEQKRIAEVVESLDRSVSLNDDALMSARNLRAALLSDLLSGNHEIPASYDQLLGAA